MSSNTIITKSYELLRYTIPILHKFPRNYKFTLADRIQNQLSDLLELYIEAYYTPPEGKKALLTKANITLEKTRHYFRLCFDMGLYSSLKYKELSTMLEEIGRMTGGWIKSINNK